MIQTQNLSKIYESGDLQTRALHSVNLQIPDGEFVAIMGPSGSGKSTLLNILGMLDKPNKGAYIFKGVDVSDFSEKQRATMRKKHIGFIFQNFNLIEELTVFENIELPLLYLGTSSTQRNELVNQMLAHLNLQHRKSHFPHQLSGGQQQRTAVARALVTNPDIILADEPTGNLDTRNGEEVMRLLTRLNVNGTTIVMVTHSAEHAQHANKVIRMLDGNINTEISQYANIL
ncbi:MAG TPA: ABC transporter ATP-binding protein [Bacteroidia bacterium]|nr:ABC transporter ATP-binding protein [Bacteroidia bacterium]